MLGQLPRGTGCHDHELRRIAPSELVYRRYDVGDQGIAALVFFSFPSDPPGSGWVAAGRKKHEAATKKPTAKGEQPLCRLRPPMERWRRQQGNRQQQLLLRAYAQRGLHGFLAFPAWTGFRAAFEGWDVNVDGSWSLVREIASTSGESFPCHAPPPLRH